MRPVHIDNPKRQRRYGRKGPGVVLCLVLLLAGEAVAAPVGPQVLGIRHHSGPEYTRIVLDLSEPAGWQTRVVDNPPRIALNLAGAVFRSTAARRVNDGIVKRIRCNEGSQRAQVVVDLTGKRAFRNFSLAADGTRPHRIVLDVWPDPAGEGRGEPAGQAHTAPAVRPFTVIIDPGHGGQDPGAMRAGLQEKDVVLFVARDMARRINALPGYRAILTRSRDRSLSLARRVEIATAEQGDVFLSIHCNAHRRQQVAGMEVYFLSLQGASDHRAQELADIENAADLVGVSLDGPAAREDWVLGILVDLHAQQMLHASAHLAESLLAVAGQDGVVRPRKVKQADFRVLHSLAMPSALVELAYLSNEADRTLLADDQALQHLAEGIVGGLLVWRQDVETLAELGRKRPELWTRDYRVRQGDNLWRLARYHGTTVTEITSHNNLKSNSLAVGQVLRLPQEMNNP